MRFTRIATTAIVLAVSAAALAQRVNYQFQDILVSSVKALPHATAIGFKFEHRQYMAALNAQTKYFVLKNGVRTSISQHEALSHITVGTKMSLQTKLGPKEHLSVLIALLLP